MQLTFWADRSDYEYMSTRSRGMGPGVWVSGARRQPCYCCDDNPSIQLMVCHHQGHQPLEMYLICLTL